MPSYLVADPCTKSTLQVTKNRFDGTLGRVPLDFVRETISMSGFGKTSTNKFSSSAVRKESSSKTNIVADLHKLNVDPPHPIGKAALTTPLPVGNFVSSTRSTDVARSGSFRILPAVELSSDTYNSNNISKSDATRLKYSNSDSFGNEDSSLKLSEKLELRQINNDKNFSAKSPSRETNTSESSELQSKSKTNAVRAEVKRQLSGTKLFTKAIKSPSNKKTITAAERNK